MSKEKKEKVRITLSDLDQDDWGGFLILSVVNLLNSISKRRLLLTRQHISFRIGWGIYIPKHLQIHCNLYLKDEWEQMTEGLNIKIKPGDNYLKEWLYWGYGLKLYSNYINRITIAQDGDLSKESESYIFDPQTGDLFTHNSLSEKSKPSNFIVNSNLT